jgi:hypothetical protein
MADTGLLSRNAGMPEEMERTSPKQFELESIL